MIEIDYYGSIIWDTNPGGWIELYSTIDVKLSKSLIVAKDLTITEGDIDIVHVDKKLKLPIKNDAASPTLQFGDGDTGFYEVSDDVLKIAIAGVARWRINGTVLKSMHANGPAILGETPTATNPSLVPDSADDDSGIGRSAADTLSLIAGGVEAHRITETTGTINHVLTGDVDITGGAGGATSGNAGNVNLIGGTPAGSSGVGGEGKSI